MKKYLKTISFNTLYQIGSRVMSSGISFLITIFIAKKMGILIYSDFAKITAFVSLFYFFADMGLNAIFLQDNKAYYKHLFYLRALICLIVIVLANFLSLLLPFNVISGIGFSNVVKLGIFIFSFTILTEGILNNSLVLFQKKFSYKNSFYSTLIGSVATLILILVFARYFSSIFFIMFAFLIGALFESGFSVFFAKEKILPPEFNIEFSKKILKESLPLSLMLVFNLIYFRVDMIILSLLKPNLDVAIYSLAFSFFDFLIALPLFLSNVLYVLFLGQEKLKMRSINIYLSIFFLLSVPICIVIFLLSPYLVLIKSSFLASSLVLRILVSFLPIFFMTSIMQWILISVKKQKFLACLYVILGAVNIVLNFIFIPQYSFIASSLITGACEIIIFIALYIKLIKEFRNVKS